MLRYVSGWRAKYGYIVSCVCSEETLDGDVSSMENPAIGCEVRCVDEMADENNQVAMTQKDIRVSLMEEQEVMSRFDEAFRPLYTTLRKQPRQSKDYQGATAIMILFMATELTRQTALQSNHTFTPDTKAMEMLTLIQDILAQTTFHSAPPTNSAPLLDTTSSQQLLTEDASRPSSHAFIFDSGVVHPLYIAATRSHDRSVRLEATRLLRGCRRREGITDSDVAACVAENLAVLDEQEEEEEDDECEYLDGEHRQREKKRRKRHRWAKLMLVEERFDVQDRKIWFRCKRIGKGRRGVSPVMCWQW